jgi:YggT family protein
MGNLPLQDGFGIESAKTGTKITLGLIRITLTFLNFIKKMTVVASWMLGIFLLVMTVLFIFRIVLSWYPQIDLNRLPFNLIAIPTEPFLVPMRRIVQPMGGVDITPIVWIGIFTLLREILLGQQGLLTMLLDGKF